MDSQLTYKCPICKARVGSLPGSRIFCSCGNVYEADEELAGVQRLPKPTTEPYNHWLKLHAYAPEHRDDWDEQAAKRFTLEWLSGVPQQCCWKNFQPILHKLGQDYSSAEAFAYKAWQWHDAVSEKLGKPRITWAECQVIWGWTSNPH